MISSSERKIWWDQQRLRISQPDCEAIERNGRLFARTLAKRCPQCGRNFWTYQRVGSEKTPYLEDPSPKPEDLIQSRETCGNPKCWSDEQELRSRIGRSSCSLLPHEGRYESKLKKRNSSTLERLKV